MISPAKCRHRNTAINRPLFVTYPVSLAVLSRFCNSTGSCGRRRCRQARSCSRPNTSATRPSAGGPRATAAPSPRQATTATTGPSSLLAPIAVAASRCSSPEACDRNGTSPRSIAGEQRTERPQVEVELLPGEPEALQQVRHPVVEQHEGHTDSFFLVGGEVTLLDPADGLALHELAQQFHDGQGQSG